MAAPTPYTDNRVLMKLFGLSALIGGGLGAGVYAQKRLSTPVDGIAPVVARETLPIAPRLSQARKYTGEKSSSTIAGVATDRPISALLAGLVGGGIGSAVGYKVPEAITARRADADLTAQLMDRKQRFEELLMQEQIAAANRSKRAEDLLNGAVDVLVDDVVDQHEQHVKSANAGVAAAASGAAGQPLMSPDTLGMLLAVTGLITGARYGYRHFTSTDRMRGEHDALEESLDFRLAGSPEGSAAPMPIKIRTDRIGATPIGTRGSGSRSARDVLSRI